MHVLWLCSIFIDCSTAYALPLIALQWCSRAGSARNECIINAVALFWMKNWDCVEIHMRSLLLGSIEYNHDFPSERFAIQLNEMNR